MGLLKFTTKTIEEYHIEEKGKTNLTEKQEASQQAPYLENN